MKTFSLGLYKNKTKTFLITDCNFVFILDSIMNKNNKHEQYLSINKNKLRIIKIDYINNTKDEFINWLMDKNNINDNVYFILSENFYDFHILYLKKLKNKFKILNSYYNGSINYIENKIEFNTTNYTFDNLDLFPKFYYYIEKNINNYEN